MGEKGESRDPAAAMPRPLATRASAAAVAFSAVAGVGQMGEKGEYRYPVAAMLRPLTTRASAAAVAFSATAGVEQARDTTVVAIKAATEGAAGAGYDCCGD